MPTFASSSRILPNISDIGNTTSSRLSRNQQGNTHKGRIEKCAHKLKKDKKDDVNTSKLEEEAIVRFNPYSFTFTIDDSFNLEIDNYWVPYFLKNYHVSQQTLTSKYGTSVDYGNHMEFHRLQRRKEQNKTIRIK